MIDLGKLRYNEFETLVGILLKREGHQIVHGPGAPGSRGPDYETVSPDGRPVVVEVKHFNFARGVGRSLVMQFVGDLERYRQQRQGVQGLLVVSSPLSAGAIEAIAQGSDLAVWDSEIVSSHLAQHKDLESIFQATIESKRLFDSKIESLMGAVASRADELSSRLRALPCGRDSWREYERICTEILTYVFHTNP